MHSWGFPIMLICFFPPFKYCLRRVNGRPDGFCRYLCFPLSLCSSQDKTTAAASGQEGTFMARHQELWILIYQSCSSNPGIDFWSHRLSLSYTASPKISEFMLWNMCEWRRKRRTNRLKQDLVSGLCAVYSSGGCTFLRQDHMTGATGVWESGSNHCWAKPTRRSDGEVEPCRVTGNLCVAFPFLRHKTLKPQAQRRTVQLVGREISKIHWILIFRSTVMPFSGVYLGQKR